MCLLYFLSLFLILQDGNCFLHSLNDCEQPGDEFHSLRHQCQLRYNGFNTTNFEMDDARGSIYCEKSIGDVTVTYLITVLLTEYTDGTTYCSSGKNRTYLKVFGISIRSMTDVFTYNRIGRKALSLGPLIPDEGSNIIIDTDDIETYVLVNRMMSEIHQRNTFYATSCNVEVIDNCIDNVANVSKPATSTELMLPQRNTNISSLIVSCFASKKLIQYEIFAKYIDILAPGLKSMKIKFCDASLKIVANFPALTQFAIRGGVATTIKTITDRAPRLEVLTVAGDRTIDYLLVKTSRHLRELNTVGMFMTFDDPRVKIFQTELKIFRAQYFRTDCTFKHDVHDRENVDNDEEQCRNKNFDILFETILPQMIRLKILELSNNNLKYINPNAFINIAKNGVVVLENNILNTGFVLNLKNLSLLDLSRNQISMLDNIKFNGNIDKLNLSFNQIEKWKLNGIFNSDSCYIKHVNLSHNKIRGFEKEMLKSLTSLESVDIGGNPLDCKNCLLFDLQQWLKSNKRTQVTNLGEHYSTIKCEYPSDMNKTLLINVPFNDLCYTNEPLYIGITMPLLISAVIIGVLSYIYRFQLKYMTHMIRVKKRAKEGRDKKKNFDYDAFVSYSSRDRTWVHDVLLKTLENDENKYALCLHERDFRLGGFIIDNVAECIERSRNVILVLSPNFVGSKWCQWELKLVQQLMFEDNPDFLILLELEKLSHNDLPSSLRLLMSTRTYLECPSGDMTNFWKRLKQALGQPLGIQKQGEEVDPEQIMDETNEIIEITST